MEEIKREHTDSLINGEINQNKNIKKQARTLVKSEDAATVIKVLENIIKSKKSNIIWLVYQQAKIFQNLRKRRNS